VIILKYNNIEEIISKILNNRNPKIYPCGKPDNTSKDDDRAPEYPTLDSLLVRQPRNQFI
jgi:hypothetical protein